MKRIRKQIQYNYSVRNEKIKYIVVHDTGNPSAGADAESHFIYFNNGNRGSSADFFVDNEQVICVNNYNKYYTYHCGDGKGAYGITNSNSVGVEMCINADGNYTETLKNTARVVRELMQELNIPESRVVRHYDASRKNCPASMNKGDWKIWDEFKQMISESEGLNMAQYEELKSKIETLINAVEELKKSTEKVYRYTTEVPEWGRPTIQKLLDKGLYKGSSESDLNLPESLLRTLVINDRAGLYD